MSLVTKTILEEYQKFFWPLFIAVLLLGVIFGFVGKPLNTQAAPFGIVSFELAGNLSNASTILSSWDDNTKLRAAFIQGLDFLFIPIYVGVIALGSGRASNTLLRKSWPLERIGIPLDWAVVFAGVLDCIENIALLRLLFGQPVNPWPQIAFWCAAPKFVIVIVGTIYIVYGAMAHLLGRGASS